MFEMYRIKFWSIFGEIRQRHKTMYNICFLFSVWIVIHYLFICQFLHLSCRGFCLFKLWIFLFHRKLLWAPCTPRETPPLTQNKIIYFKKNTTHTQHTHKHSKFNCHGSFRFEWCCETVLNISPPITKQYSTHIRWICRFLDYCIRLVCGFYLLGYRDISSFSANLLDGFFLTGYLRIPSFQRTIHPIQPSN